MSRSKPSSCDGCPCQDHGTDFSQVTGLGSLGVLIVAEASGEHEAREQRPLISWAPAGSLLERSLRRMGYSREQFWITNVLRCRPRKNWLEGSPWEFRAIDHCRPNLNSTIDSRRPRAILALGGVATRELTGLAGEKRGVSHLCGYVVPGPASSSLPIPVIPTFHPAFIRRGAANLQGIFSRCIRRAVNVASGTDSSYLFNVNPEEPSTYGKLRYQLYPSLDEARAFAQRVRDSESRVLSYDIETYESASLDEDARDGFTDTQIRLVQFSLGRGEGIAIPYKDGYREIIADTLQTPNLKCGHNIWLFDNKVLRAAGERDGINLTPAGTLQDTLQMYHHWQPDLPANLQFASQFVNFPFPWKHLSGAHEEFYGCCDVDATWQLQEFLESALRRENLWEGWVEGEQSLGYIGQIQEVRPVLAAMEDRGIPINDTARRKLDGEFRVAGIDIAQELMGRFPESAKKLVTYKKFPPELKGIPEPEYGQLFQEPDKWKCPCGRESKLDIEYCPKCKVSQEKGKVKAGKWYRYGIRDILEDGVPTPRWCYIPEFNPNSSQQLIDYIKLKGYKVPKSKQTDEEGNAKDTTSKKELVRLANKTGDNFFLRTIEFRELTKIRGTYIDGFRPASDGAVHTTFTFDTGTGQLTSRNPNIQNFPKHGRLAKAIRAIVDPGPDRLIVEWDYKSYHVLTTGFEAQSASYMRMARLDMHSFVAGCFLKLWTPQIMELSDGDLLERFKWFKTDADRKRVRDKQAKPSILGIGFGMKYRRLYQENLEHFDREKTAKTFMELIESIWPEVFEWQSSIQDLAHRQTFLRSKFGHIRRFYEVKVWDNISGKWKNGDQAEEAVAFLPANHAFGNIRECLKDLDRRGLAEKYLLCNNVHDSAVFNIAASQLGKHINEVYPVMTLPSKVLKHPSLAPKGLSVDVEVNAGVNWAVMKEVDTKPYLDRADRADRAAAQGAL